MCEEKTRLLKWYEKLELALGKNLTALNQRVGTASKGESEALRLSVKIARVETKRARIALEAHVIEHKCQAAPPALNRHRPDASFPLKKPG